MIEKYIKNLNSSNKAILEHYKTNMDKVKQNNDIINNSQYEKVIVDYEFNILDNKLWTFNRLKKILYVIKNKIINVIIK